MKIEKIDVNFKKEEYIESEKKIVYTMPNDKFRLYGVSYDEKLGQFTRMDHEVAQKVSEGVGYLSTHTSGGRVRFATDSTTIAISVAYPSLDDMPHMPLTGSAGFALLEKDGNTYKTVCMFRPNHAERTGYTGEVKVESKGIREYIMFFPLYNPVSELKIILESSAVLREPETYRDVAPILYYGASIDQGGCVSRPDGSYTAMLSKWNDIDFINLGFSGSCRGEQLMAEYLSGIDCSLFFMAYDGNAPSAAFLEETHYPFYETFRRGNKDVPIIFMSVPCFDGFPEGNERRQILKNTYTKARENGDDKVYFLDGEILFGESDREMCTVEGLHPNDLGSYRIAKVIEKLYQEIGL